MNRYFAPLVLTLVIAAIPIIVMPKVASQQPPKEQGQNEQQLSDLHTNTKPQVDQSGQQQSQSGAKDKENDESKKQGLWDRFLDVAARNDKAVVAISTIVIAAFTALLFVATILLWWGGERHSRRELRAYVSVTPKLVLLSIDEGKIVGVDCTIKNHGQTPAFEVNYVFGISVLAPNSELPIAGRKITENAAVFPNAEISTRFFSERPLTSKEADDVGTGTRRLHLWGTATYRDAFRKRRTTRFSASVGGHDFAEHIRAVRHRHASPPEFRWMWEDRHNDAT